MASEIRVNKINNRAGLGTITIADTGVVVNGIVTCTEVSGLNVLNIAGVSTFANTLDINGDIDVDGHTNLDNLSVAGVSTFSDNITLNGGLVASSSVTAGQIIVGSGVTIESNQVATGQATFTGIVTASSFRGDGSQLTGVTSVGGNTGVDFNDNVKVRLGTGNDLEIYYDGTDGWIKNVGKLKIESTNDQIEVRGDIIYLRNRAANQNYFYAANNAFVGLTYAGDMRLETESTGIKFRKRLDPETDSTVDLGTNAKRWRNIYADTYYGDGSNLTGITGTTINSNADNRVITGSGTANTLNAESNLTYNGQKLNLGTVDGGADVISALRNTNANGFGAYISGGNNNSQYILRLDDKDQNECFRVTGDGNVGILNGSPQRKLHIGNSGYSESNIRIQGGSDYAEIRVKDSDNNLSFHHNVGGAGSRELFNSNGSTGHFSINCYSYQALTITTNENGTNGPELSLFHNSASPAASDSIAQIRFNAKDSAGNTDLYARIHANLSSPTSGSESGDLVFATRGSGTFAERLRITSTGQLLMGTPVNTGYNESAALISIAADTSAAANMLSDSSAIYNHTNPAFIHVQNRYNTGTGQEAGIIFHSRSSHNGSWAIYGKRTGSSYLSDLIFRNRTGGSASTERLRLTSDGYLQQHKLIAVSYSDSREIALSNTELTRSNFYNTTNFESDSSILDSNGHFVAPVHGIYRLYFRCSTDGDVGNRANVRLRKNGNTINEAYANNNDSNDKMSVSSEIIMELDAGEYLDIQVGQLHTMSGNQHKVVNFHMLG